MIGLLMFLGFFVIMGTVGIIGAGRESRQRHAIEDKKNKVLEDAHSRLGRL